MRVVLVTYGSRGDVEPMASLALQLRALGTAVRVCAPPDFTGLLADIGVPLTPLGWPIRALATGAIVTAPKTLPDIAIELIPMTYDTVAAVADGCDAVVATGSLPAVAATQAAAEKLGVPFGFASFSPSYLPSPHHRPRAWHGQVLPADETDNRVLWNAVDEHLNTLFGKTINSHRVSIDLPPIHNIRAHVQTDHPFLAADPVLGPWQQTTDLDVAQTGAWTRADERPLTARLEAFLDAGTPPVYVGFGSMPLRGTKETVAQAAIQAVRAQRRRVLLGRGWADLELIDDQDDCIAVGEVNQQALFRRVAAVMHHGGAGTTTTAARAGAPQVIVPQVADQHYWASRVTELGIGHESSVPNTESLSAALDIALAPETATRAAAVADTVCTDGAALAAKLLLGMSS